MRLRFAIPYRISALLLALTTILSHLQAQDYRQLQTLSGDEIESGDLFGHAVDIDGNTAIVGAYSDDIINPWVSLNSGSIYIYELDSMGFWQQVLYDDRAWASSSESPTWMGYSVSISGDYAMVGVPQDDDGDIGTNPVTRGGSVFVYERNAEGQWEFVQVLWAGDRGENDYFGRSVAISSNGLAIVGASGRDIGGVIESAGGAYFFQRNGNGTWVQTQVVESPDGTPNTHFGWSCDIDGDQTIVGTESKSVAFVYERDGNGNWIFEEGLIPNNVLNDNRAGHSVAISGDYCVLGAYADQENVMGGDPLNNAGAAYIFNKLTGNWLQSQKLIASDRSSNDRFGFSVDMDGDRCLIGATDNKDHGTVYVFERDNVQWNEVQTIDAPDGGLEDEFGSDVALSGSRLIVGSDGARPDFSSPASGTAHVLMQCESTTPTVTQSFMTLMTNTDSLFYQWYSCDDTALVDGATAYTYEPFVDGGYSVIVSTDGCRDTSDCYEIALGIETSGTKDPINLYPNPASELLNLEIPSEWQPSMVRLFNVDGTQLGEHRFNSGPVQQIPVEHLSPGIYYLQIHNENQIWNRQIMKL